MQTIQNNQSGDNVAGDKHVYYGLHQQNVANLIQEVFESILLLDINKANESLITIKKIQSIDSATESVIKLLEILQSNLYQLANLENSDINFFKQKITDSNQQVRTLALINLIIYLANSENHSEAKEVYDRFCENAQQDLLLPIFARVIADENQLDEYYADNKYILTDFALYNLAFICGIKGTQQLRSHILSSLEQLSDSRNRSFFTLWVEKFELFKIFHTDYNLITFPEKQIVEKFIKECETVIQQGLCDWRFTLNIIVPVFHYIGLNNGIFFEECLKHQEQIKLNFYDTWLILAAKSQKIEISNEDSVIEVIRQAIADENFKKTKIDEITSKAIWTADDIDFIFNFSRETATVYNSQKITLDINNLNLKKIIELRFKLTSYIENETKYLQENEIEDLLNDISEIEVDKRLSSSSIFEICLDLMELDCSFIVVRFLKPLFENPSDLWGSPIVNLYAQALYKSKQHKEFDKFWQKIHPHALNSALFYFKALICFYGGDLKGAFKNIKNSIRENRESFYAWDFYSHLALTNELNKKDIYFENLPDSLLEPLEKHHTRILFALTKYGHFAKVELLLCNLFLASPQKAYMPVTDFILGSLFQTSNLQFSQQVGSIKAALAYTVDDKPYRKLILDKNSSEYSNEYCVREDTPRGQELLSIEKGIPKPGIFGEICLLEKYPPLLLIHHICIDLRVEMNDGKDAFQSIPFDENDVAKSINRLISHTSRLQEERDSIVEDLSIPYCFKVAHLFDNDLVPGSLALMGNEKSASQLGIYDFGMTEKQFVIDVHGCVYLAISGLCKTLTTDYQIAITRETKEIIRAWIDGIAINKDSGGGLLQVSKNSYNLVDNKVVFENTQTIRANLEHLLSKCDIIAVKPVNLPHSLVRILSLEYIDISVKTTLECAFTNDKPIFTLDPILARLFADNNSVKILNPSILVDDLVSKTSFKYRKEGIRYFALFGLPVPLNYTDILNYGADSDTSIFHILTLLIEKIDFKNNVLMHILLSLVMLNSYYHLAKILRIFQNESLEVLQAIKLSHMKLVNTILYKVTRYPSQNLVEDKMAEFILMTIEVINKSGYGQFNLRMFEDISIFCGGHFILVTRVVESMKSLLKEKYNDSSYEPSMPIN